jgi:hypothetical protein
MPAPGQQSCVGSAVEASLRRPRPAREAARSGDLRLGPGFLGACGQLSVDLGRTSPAGVVVVHRSRSSCCERRRPWPQVIDPPQDAGKQRPRHRHLGQLEQDVAACRRSWSIAIGFARSVTLPGGQIFFSFDRANCRFWLCPVIRDRRGVRPLPWSKPTLKPQYQLLILLLQLHIGQRTGSEWDDKA